MKRQVLSAFLLATSTPVFAEDSEKVIPCFQIADDSGRKACEEKMKPTQAKVDLVLKSKEGVPCWQVAEVQRVEKGCPVIAQQPKVVDPLEPCGKDHPMGCSCDCCKALPYIEPPSEK